VTVRRLVVAALWLSSVAAAGFVGARAWDGPSSATPPAVAVRPSCPTVAGAPGLSAATVRAIVREELAALAPAQAAPPPASDEARGDTDPPRPELVRAHTLVDEALARGRWAEMDRDRLRLLLGALSAKEAEEVLGVITPAINAGRIQPEFVGPLL
jgi:hypothetical protein